MKKNLFSSIALSFLMFFGAVNASAQMTYAEMKPENATLANQVISLQMSNPDKANTVFAKLLRKVKDDKAQLLSVGHFFLDQKVYPCAKQCVERAYNLPGGARDMKVLMLQGEVYSFGRQYGLAGQKFDEILLIDSTNIYALRNKARVYKYINPAEAMATYQKIKEVDPKNADADKNMGDICYEQSQYANAVEYYKAYYSEVPHTQEAIELRACENYLLSLFSVAAADGSKSDEYAETMLTVLNDVQPFEPGNMVFKRMRFYANMAKYNSLPTSDALATAEASAAFIVNKEHVDSLYLFQDYFTMAQLMKSKEDYASAVNYMRLAVARDSSNALGYKELADNLASMGESQEAIVQYSTYLDKMGDKARNADYFRLARMYGAAASQETDAAKQAELIGKVDATLDKVEAHNPGAVSVAVTRAQLHILDGSKPQDDVKALYEEVLRRCAGKEGMEDTEAQAYQYLLFYDIQKDNLDGARQNCTELLKRDPESDLGKKADTYLKSLGK